jgi:hypothetical protein
MKTTLNKIRAHSPCSGGWEKLLKTLGKTKADDEPLDMLTVFDSNGLDDALWCLRAVEGHDDAIRKLACDFALEVADLWDMPVLVREYLTTRNESLRAAARDAARDAAWSAARAAARAAARDAARDAAWSAARDAARDAAWSAARDAAWSAARDAAWDAARERQTIMFCAMCEGGL